jgi:ribosome maturation factor RimP
MAVIISDTLKNKQDGLGRCRNQSGSGECRNRFPIDICFCAAKARYNVIERRVKRVGESPLFCWSRLFAGLRFGTMHEAVASKIEEIAQRVAQTEGIEVVDVEVKGGGNSRFVRISIDKPAGVTHADCELISQQVGTILDVEDVVPGGRYTLEVSSPGVERKLNKPQDFERFQGKKARVLLRTPVQGQREWEGTLCGIADGQVTLEEASATAWSMSAALGGVREGRVKRKNVPVQTVRFPLELIEKANLKFEW